MFLEELEEENPQTLKEILAIYAMIDAQTAGWTTCMLREFGVVHDVKAEINRPTQDHMWKNAIY